MRAMVLERPRTPLVMRERSAPEPASGEILIEVAACGVCRTDLHVVDGELPNPKLPIVPGHEIVGRVAAMGAGVAGLAIGERVGVPWLGSTCGLCPYCRSGRENLCDRPLFTGYTRDGGYATRALADARTLLRAGRLQQAMPGQNTTIGVVATNARLTKTQATKVAQMAHDGVARAIYPSHTMGDGDTMFALATGGLSADADVSRVGALGAEMVSDAIMRAARQATGIPGYPAARDLQR